MSARPLAPSARLVATAPVAAALSGGAMLRVAAWAGAAIAAALALGVGRPELLLASDPELARLLRGMAVIKGGLVLLAMALLTWRLGQPLPSRLAAVYLGSVWLAAAASVLIWQLSFIGLAAVAFHGAELAFLAAAWMDGRGRRPRA